jgi:hypothetical protein
MNKLFATLALSLFVSAAHDATMPRVLASPAMARQTHPPD